MTSNTSLSPKHDSTHPENAEQASAEAKLPTIAYVLCGWPLLLVAIGGAIGGGLGGAAFAVNLGIYKSSMPLALKVVLNIVTGLAAVAIWFGIALAIAPALQG